MRDTLKAFIDGLARWPLLLGAVICFALVIYEETVTDKTEIVIAVAGGVVGSVLLGAWLVSYIIDGERRHHRTHRREDDCPDLSPPRGDADPGAGPDTPPPSS